VELETIDFDLRVTVEGVTEALAPNALEKGLELACMVHHSVPVLLKGDPGRLKQILLNLGSNAVKFTEKGEVIIRVDLQEESEDSVTLVFSVTDTGTGVPEDKQKEVFESFVQVDGSTTRAYSGTGLGLSICKRLVELLGGQIGLESDPGKGSRFWFRVTCEKQTESTDVLPPVTSDIRGKRILVIDDNATNRRILVNMLESFGCSADSGGGGAEALDLLKKATREKKVFDLLLLDKHMPGMDGEQTLRAIKDEPEIKDVPVVILTSAGMRGDVARLQALSCIGYLLKPVKQSQLHDLIVTVLTRQDTELGSGPVRIVTRHTLTEQKRRRVRILIVEDNPMNQKVAVSLLKRAGYLVEAVENGKMAIEAMKSKPCDLVFMDIQLPEMDGLEATKTIREMEGAKKHTPIIALTAYAMKGDQERFLEAGLDDYISKPIEPQELLDATDKWTKSIYLENEVWSENERDRKPGITTSDSKIPESSRIS
jgi:CheY-like chemotaxis protein